VVKTISVAAPSLRVQFQRRLVAGRFPVSAFYQALTSPAAIFSWYIIRVCLAPNAELSTAPASPSRRWPISVFTLLRMGLPTCGPLFWPIVNHYAVLLFAGLFHGSISGAQNGAVRSRRKPETFLCGHVGGLNHRTTYSDWLDNVPAANGMAIDLLACTGDACRAGNLRALRCINHPATAYLDCMKPLWKSLSMGQKCLRYSP